MTMHEQSNTTEQQTGTTTPPADTIQQAQQQGNQPGGEAGQGGTAQTEGQQQEGQQGQEQQRERDEQGRFKPPVQKRIDELTRARREAEREAEYWRQQATGRAQTSGQEPALQEPRPEQFEDYGQYTKALARYEAQQLLAQRDQAQSQTAQERAQQAEQQANAARTEAWVERQQAVKQVLPDYDTVMQAAANVHVSQAVQEALLDSDRGPELAYHLAKNPQLAQQLSGMSARQVDREIGRLEERLARPAPPPVSKAPPPLKPLTGSGAATKSEAQMTDAEWLASRRSQRAT